MADHVLLTPPARIVDWYFREFIPTLLTTADVIDAQHQGVNTDFAARLRDLPKVTYGSPVESLLELATEIGGDGLAPDETLLGMIEDLCGDFNFLLVRKMNRSFADARSAKGAEWHRPVLRPLSEWMRNLHVDILYRAVAPLMDDQRPRLGSDAARALALSQARTLMNVALSA